MRTATERRGYTVVAPLRRGATSEIVAAPLCRGTKTIECITGAEPWPHGIQAK